MHAITAATAIHNEIKALRAGSPVHALQADAVRTRFWESDCARTHRCPSCHCC